MAVIGCGTSLFAAQALAAWREQAGQGETDAFPASEMPADREYDVVLAISRSGTTTEVLRVLKSLRGRDTYAIVATPASPMPGIVAHSITLPFADEAAIVQTRFPTSVLALWRAVLGHDVEALAAEAEAKLVDPMTEALDSCEQFVFLGQGPGAGLANEAALKLREAALAWTEAYPAMELRHGPISVLGPHSMVWALDPLPPGLADEIRRTGAHLVAEGSDSMVELVRIHRAAIALARARGLDPDRPRRLKRSVVLD